MKSRMDSWQQFLILQKQHELLSLPVNLDAILDNCEYLIHLKFNKNSKSQYKFKKRKHDITKQYREALKTLSTDQRLDYYTSLMKLVQKFFQGKLNVPKDPEGFFQGQVYARSYNIKKWKHKILRLDRKKCVLYAQRQSKIKTYNLSDYILRRSKVTQYHSLVLEAINKNPHQKSRTVHFGFKQASKLQEWFSQIQKIMIYLREISVMKYLSENQGSIKRLTSSQVMAKKQAIQKQQEQSEDSDDDVNSQMSKSVYQEQMEAQQQSKKNDEIMIEDKNKQNSKSESQTNNQDFIPRNRRKTIVEQISQMDDPDQIQQIQEENDQLPIQQQKQNIFHKIIPEYTLSSIEDMVNYSLIQGDTLPAKIYSKVSDTTKLKYYTLIQHKDVTADQISIILCNSDFLKQINSQIQQFTVKTLIRSQNSALIYFKLKQYNRLYRSRDFVILRHVFKVRQQTKDKIYEQNIYIVDKSIQNINIPPFTTIVRGELTNIWKINKINNGVQIIGDIQIKNNGYLKQSQDVNLAVKYLNGFKQLQKKVSELKYNKINIMNYKVFSCDWVLYAKNNDSRQSAYKKQTALKNKISTKTENSEQKPNPNSFKKIKSSQKSDSVKKQTNNQQKVKQKIQDNPKLVPAKIQEVESDQSTNLQKHHSNYRKQDEQVDGQLNEKDLQQQEKNVQITIQKIHRDFNQQGHVIIGKQFVKNKYITKPLPKSEINYMQIVNGHPIWKGDWKHDDKHGSIIFINEKKIQDQKGVLKFILTKIGKNILSGKSVMNISLPVDIFSAQSNLQLLMYSLCFAPIKLQPSCSLSLLERFKKVIAFAISNSPLYLNMQKPFNPILGETFQCYIDGCPGYAQQISHHPPIAAIMYKGRGYDLTAQLESKVELHMNSGCGTNEGIFRIKYDDGVQICYITPGGQVSGLTYGDRKFNMVGKSYIWTQGTQSQQSSYFVELVFNPSQKGFFGGKQEKPIDYYEGNVVKVKKQYISQFLAKKKGSPPQKQIIQKVGKASGIWNKQSMFENECILDIDKQVPAKLQYDAAPLPSDANWRQDIAYRRLMQITRAQSQKQRLQVLQRKDRKLRQKYSGKKH